jgi:hypothetical protein
MSSGLLSKADIGATRADEILELRSGDSPRTRATGLSPLGRVGSYPRHTIASKTIIRISGQSFRRAFPAFAIPAEGGWGGAGGGLTVIVAVELSFTATQVVSDQPSERGASRRDLHQHLERSAPAVTDGSAADLVQMYRWFPLILEAVTIVRPETLVHWHRAGFRRFWRWKSNSRGGRP